MSLTRLLKKQVLKINTLSNKEWEIFQKILNQNLQIIK